MLLDRKKILYIGISIGIVLAAVIFGYTYRSQLIGGNDAQSERTVLQIQEKLGELISARDAKDCKKLGDAYYETVCVNNIALELAMEKLDVSYCGQMDNTLISIADCERAVVSQKSINAGNASVCDEATNEEVRTQCRDGFFITLAFAKQDVAICNNENGDRKNVCMNTYLLQKEFMPNPTAFDCDRFIGTDVQNDCKSLNRAQRAQVSEICGNLETQLFAGYCVEQSIRPIYE